MALTQADLDRLETNIGGGNTWVEGDENTDGIDATGGEFQSIRKVNAAAVAAFNNQLLLIGFQVPVLWSIGLLIDNVTKTVDEAGIIYAPIVSKVPFTTGGAFDPANWYVIQGVVASSVQNEIINGNFEVWLRGLAFTSPGYTADRWKVGSLINIDRVTTGIADSATFGLKSTNAGANPSIDQGIELPITGAPGKFIIGSAWTFSTDIIADAAGDIKVALIFRDVVRNSTNEVSAASTNTIAVTTGVQRLSTTFTITGSPAGTNKALDIIIFNDDGAIANFTISEVQFEAGSLPTSFIQREIEEVRSSCRRYYQKSYDIDTDPGAATSVGAVNIHNGNVSGTEVLQGSERFPEMRDAPAITIYDLAGNTGKMSYTNTAGAATIDNQTGTADIPSTSAFRFFTDAVTTKFGLLFQYELDAEL